mgnify:CR=1 FL=1
MQTEYKRSITIDLKKSSVIPLPSFVQQDTNIIEFTILDNGEVVDLTTVGRIVVNYKRPDKEIFSRLLVGEGNVVVYEIGSEEMAVDGYGEMELQFYSKDNLQRISTKRFKVYMSSSLGVRAINEKELTTLQELFVEVETIKKETTEAELTREQNEASRKNQEENRQKNTSEAIQRLNEEVNNLKLNYLLPVPDYGDIGATYPNPEVGDIVQTTTDGKFYRWDGTTWAFNQQFSNNAVTDLQNRLSIVDENTGSVYKFRLRQKDNHVVVVFEEV